MSKKQNFLQNISSNLPTHLGGKTFSKPLNFATLTQILFFNVLFYVASSSRFGY